ncbi:MAG TPA: helix-turn-helix domain-containing protein [Trebonia sp.]|nr:helix-turn-helix domain-containing protein [Trebonia sp.]
MAHILRLFSESARGLSVAEAAERTGLNRSTAHRYFSTMVAEQILERDRDEPTTYVPGRLMLELGTIAQGQRHVLEAAPPHMRALSKATSLTVTLSLWSAFGPIVSLVSEPSTHPVLLTVRVGTRLGPESAQTRLYLALSEEAGIAEQFLAPLAPRDRQEVTASFAEIRKTGICRVPLPNIDAVGIAAPVFDHHDIAATIALLGTVSSLSITGSPHEDALADAAAAVTAEMGGAETARRLTGR